MSRRRSRLSRNRTGSGEDRSDIGFKGGRRSKVETKNVGMDQVADIKGIGDKTTARLKELGITSLQDLKILGTREKIIVAKQCRISPKILGVTQSELEHEQELGIIEEFKQEEAQERLDKLKKKRQRGHEAERKKDQAQRIRAEEISKFGPKTEEEKKRGRVWTVRYIVEAYNEEKESKPGYTDLIPIAEIKKRIMKAHPHVSEAEINKKLLMLEKERRIDLQIAYDPQNVIDKEYGIESQRGLIMYVRWRIPYKDKFSLKDY